MLIQRAGPILMVMIVISFLNNPLKGQEIRIYEAQSENITTLTDEDGETHDWFELINTAAYPVSLNGYGIGDDLNPDSAWRFPDYILEPGEVVLAHASGKDRNSELTYWQTLISQGDTLKYIIPHSNISNWYGVDYNDSYWNSGPSGFGYGDGDDATVIGAAVSIFIRGTFYIDDLSSVVEAVLHMDYDDGFVAYLNGVEIARSSTMEAAGITPSYNTPAPAQHEAGMYQGREPEEFPVNDFSALLKEGKNVLAIQAHNVSTSSSDFSATPYFSVLLSTKPEAQRKAYFLPWHDDFHTHFRLDADSDSLILFDPDNHVADQLIFKSPGPDVSLGYAGTDFSKIMAFIIPTPYSLNNTDGVELSELPEVKMDTEAGLFSSNVTVSLYTETSEGSIYYTTNGQPPSAESVLYTGPVTLSEPATLQARVLKEGFWPGKISTGSFYPNYNKSLPVTFITTDPKYLWDENFGIYVMGNNASPDFPHYGANFWMDWERPAHVEMYFPDRQNNYNIDAGIKIFGGWSRGHPQKSVTVFARNKYGYKSIKSKLFDDRPMDKFEAVVYRNSGNDWVGGDWTAGTYYRDLVITKIGDKLGIDVQAGRPTIFYLNSEYWGIQNLREKVNEHFVAGNHNEDPEKIDLLEGNLDVVEGDNLHFANMLAFLENNNISVEDNFEYVRQQMDIDEFILYNIVEIYCFNGDWPGNNLKYWRPQRPNGRWRWIMFDTDFGFGIWDHNKVYHETMYFATEEYGPDWPNPPWSTFVLRKLFLNPGFRNRFINAFADHLNTTFKPDYVKSMIDERIGEIQAEIPFHTDRWGWSYSGWMTNNQNVKNFVDARPDVLWSHLIDFFSLNGTRNLQVSVKGANNVKVRLNTINLNEYPWNGTYFDNVPVELTAIPPEGFRFIRWEGDVSSKDANISLEINSNKSVTAVFEAFQPGETEGVIINEISYRAPKEEDSEDWVELFNNSSQFIDISGWIIQDSEESHRFTIPENTVIGPGQYLVIARDLYEFSEIHPTVYNVIGPLGFGFSGAGECIYLYNSEGILKDQVCYANEYPWPEEANGKGYTLSLSDPDKDNMPGYNWSNSPVLNGTPGRANTGNTPVEHIINQTAACTLFDCYPNPFDRLLHIPVVNDKAQDVSIDVYSANGQLIANLFKGTLNKGLHEFEWGSTINNSGLFIIKLQTQEGVQVKKVLRVN